jgi:hypothetical protein
MNTTYTAQIWDKETLLSQIEGLSLSAAREICSTAPLTGHSGRVWCDTRDYTEVFDRRGVRRGPYAVTTIVVTV